MSAPLTGDQLDLEAVIWAVADGRGSDVEVSRLRADQQASLAVVDTLIRETEVDLDSVRSLTGDEREQVVADLTDTLQSLREVAARVRGTALPERRPEPPVQLEEPAEVELQASWSSGLVVVWAGGRGRSAESHDEVSARLEAVGASPVGWQAHPGVRLPGGSTAACHAIALPDALGWLVSIGAGHRADEVGTSLRWLGRVAYEGVRLTASGSIVPTIRARSAPRAQRGRQAQQASQAQQATAEVRWRPALVDTPTIAALAAAMPGPVAIIGRGSGRAMTTAVLTAVVEAIVAESVERMELPAAPPAVRSPRDMQDAVIAGMDGSPFHAPKRLIDDAAHAIERWTRGVTATSRPKLIVRLDAPGEAGVWLVSVLLAASAGEPVPIDAALRQERGSHTITAEWDRLGRAFPSMSRSSGPRRGQLALTQDQAWDVMTTTGPMLAAIGFDVRVPTMSRRKATPMLRLLAESSDTVVGAHQLSNVTWSVLFDDVELTPAEIAQLAKQARPLVRSRNGWVEIDRIDLEQAAAALAEREADRQLTGAEILRHSLGLDGTGLRVDVHGHSWATDILAHAAEAAASPLTRPPGFTGELRSYQADALAWIGFLERADLGGCLALDMGLGKTPTVLAHLARGTTSGPALVIAPAAVVGNWAAEAARFTPGLRVVIHHGASRASAGSLAAEIEAADVLITTYATAVRDVDALAAASWATCVLDEAQAIKNPASETAQQLRRIPARMRLALTGTPIENGLGDLWAILDFTNPGLVGTRPAFVAQLAGDAESALRSLNGLLVFRRTKREPEVAAELPDKIDELDHCTMTPEQIGLYQAVLDTLVADVADAEVTGEHKKGAILAAITALKQICNHPAAYRDDDLPLAGRSGKLARLEEIVHAVFAAGERVLVFTHFASVGSPPR